MSPRWTPDPDIRRGNHVIHHLHVHLVFVTKYRRDFFNDETSKYCEEVMRKVCADFQADLREFNEEGDHVHLLVHHPPKVSVSKLVNSLKGVSSRHLRAHHTERLNKAGMGSVFWSPSYFAGSCGGAPLSTVAEYIENQKHPS